MLRKMWLLTKDLGLILLLIFSGVTDFGPIPAQAAGPEQPVTQISVAGGLEDVKIAAGTQLSNKLAFGVRKDWPELVAILDKALSSTPVEERARIETRWVNIHFEERTDWGFILWMGMGASATMAIIFGIIFLWNRRLAREAAQRKKAEMRFQAMAANVPGAIFQIRVLPDGGRKYEYLSPGSP